MIIRSQILILGASLLIAACGNSDNKGEAKEKPEEPKATDAAASDGNRADPGSATDNILGEWTLEYTAIDKNYDSKLDDAETKDPITQSKNYIMLNADGTAKLYELKVDCRYTLKEESGKRKIYFYDKNSQEIKKYNIYSVKENELILLNYHGEKTFEVYRRV